MNWQATIEFITGPKFAALCSSLLFVISEIVGSSSRFKSGGVIEAIARTIGEMFKKPAIQGAGMAVAAVPLVAAGVGPLGVLGTIQLAFQTFNRLYDLGSKMIELKQKYDLNKWLDELEQTIDGLEKAQTPEEKLNAAKSLSRLVRNLG